MNLRASEIMIVLHDLPLGDTERITLRLAKRWTDLERKVTILCGARSGPLVEMIDSRVKVLECDPRIPRGPGSRRALGRATLHQILAASPDILFIPGNCHWPVLDALNDLSAQRMAGIVAQISTPLYRHGRGRLGQVIYNHRMRSRFRRVDSAIALSPGRTADADRILGRPVTQHLRLPALEEAPMACVKAPTRAQGRVILAAGRLVKEKGFDVTLRAFAMLNDPAARLVILGEGPSGNHSRHWLVR